MRKKRIVWNKGLTKETDARVAKYAKKLEGHKYHGTGKEWFKKGQTSWMKDRKVSSETKEKISNSLKGAKSSFWQGGISYEEYSSDFDSPLKEQVRFRDGYKCKLCGCPQIENGQLLSVHHIDYDKQNNTLSNLVALCRVCHAKTNSTRKYWIQKLGVRHGR